MRNKRTKIVATVSDLRCDVDFIKDLWRSGVDAIRLNTAHQSTAQTKMIVDNVRQASDRLAIIIDTKGPEIRTIGLTKPLAVKEGTIVHIYNNENPPADSSQSFFNVNFSSFVQEVPVNSDILIDDGELLLTVIDKTDEFLTCVVRNEGQIKNKKSINVPNVHLNLPSLTEKDIEYINFSIEEKVDFIAHSFVRNKEDILEVQKLLDQANSSVKIIAKIENQEGVNNLEEIIEQAYGVMVARGDLGIELPPEQVPVIQKEIIKTCIRYAKPVITATQMLHSMIISPRPTRAEVSDVANAIFDGTDAVMLSGETAYGRYPLEAVQMISLIAKNVEEKKDTEHSLDIKMTVPIRFCLIKAAVDAAKQLGAKALMVHSISGRSARLLAAYRSHTPVYALCTDDFMMRALALSYGVTAYQLAIKKTTNDLVCSSFVKLMTENEITAEDLIVMLGNTLGVAESTNFIEIGKASIFTKIRN